MILKLRGENVIPGCMNRPLSSGSGEEILLPYIAHFWITVSSSGVCISKKDIENNRKGSEKGYKNDSKSGKYVLY